MFDPLRKLAGTQTTAEQKRIRAQREAEERRCEREALEHFQRTSQTGGAYTKTDWQSRMHDWQASFEVDQCVTPHELSTLSRHRSGVTSLTVLANGRLASVGSSARPSIKLSGVVSGECETKLRGHSNWIRSLTVLADGRLASGSDDGTIKLWDLSSGECTSTILGHSSWIRSVTVLADGRLASGNQDKSIKLWDVVSNRCVSTLRGHSEEVQSLTVLPDGRLASGSWDTTIKLWDVGLRPKASLARDVLVNPNERGLVEATKRFLAGQQQREQEAEERERQLEQERHEVKRKTQAEQEKLAKEKAEYEHPNAARDAFGSLRNPTSTAWDPFDTSSAKPPSNVKWDAFDSSNRGDTSVAWGDSFSINSTPAWNPFDTVAANDSANAEWNAFGVSSTHNRPSTISNPFDAQPAAKPLTPVPSSRDELRSPTQASMSFPATTQESQDQFDVSDLGRSLPVTLIPEAEIKLGYELGRGGFGVVYAGEYDFRKVAVKRYDGARLPERALREVRHEVSIMSRLDHECLVRFFGLVQQESSPAMLVMEYGASGSLYEYLHSDQDVTWGLRLRLAEELARGLAYLHKKKIVHRDIKSLNIVLDSDLHAKWCDFGLAVLKLHSTTTSKNPAVSQGGTIQWMAPELFARRTSTPSTASDIWALGMVFFELASRNIPFSDAQSKEQIMAWIQSGDGEEVPEACEQQAPVLASLMRRCWAERTARPQAAEIARELGNHDESSMSPSDANQSGNVMSGTDSGFMAFTNMGV